MAVRVAVAEREVGRIVGHGVALGLDAKAHVRQREVGAGGLGHGNALYGVALLLVGCSVESVVQCHIGIQRIVLGFGNLLGDRVVEWGSHFHLVGEQLAQLNGGRQRVGLVVLCRTCCHAVFQSTEALGDNFTRKVECADI